MPRKGANKRKRGNKGDDQDGGHEGGGEDDGDEGGDGGPEEAAEAAKPRRRKLARNKGSEANESGAAGSDQVGRRHPGPR